MCNNEISDLNLPSFISCDSIDSILEKVLTKDEFKLISSMKINIKNAFGFYKISDLNKFFLVSLSTDYYSTFKLQMSYHKESIINHLIQYRRNCKKISDELDNIKYKNFLNEDIEMSLFDFSSAFCIPFYDAYSMYLKYHENFNEFFKKNDDDKKAKKYLGLFMKIFNCDYALANFTDILNNYDYISKLRNKNCVDAFLFMLAREVSFDSIKDYLSIFLLLDDIEIITKKIMTEEEENYIKSVGKRILSNSKIDFDDLIKICEIAKEKISTKDFNTELINAIINENYDFLQKDKSKIIDFNSALKK